MKEFFVSELPDQMVDDLRKVSDVLLNLVHGLGTLGTLSGHLSSTSGTALQVVHSVEMDADHFTFKVSGGGALLYEQTHIFKDAVIARVGELGARRSLADIAAIVERLGIK